MREIATRLMATSGKLLVVCEPTASVTLPPRWKRSPTVTVSFDSSRCESVCSPHAILSISSDPADAGGAVIIPWASVRAIVEIDDAPGAGPYRTPPRGPDASGTGPLSSSESGGAASPSRKAALRALLDAQAVARIHLDPRQPGVVVPRAHAQAPSLALLVGYRITPPIPDLFLGNDRLTCTLGFAGEPFACVIPWSAVFAITDQSDRGVLWDEAVPPEHKSAVRVVGASSPPAPAATTTRSRPGARQLSAGVRAALVVAGYEAVRRGHQVLTVEHVLAGLAYDDVTAFVLRHAGARIEDLERALASYLDGATFGRAAAWSNTFRVTAAFSTPASHPDLQRVLRRAHQRAYDDRAAEISGRHILIAALAEPPGIARQLLTESGLDPRRLPSEDALLVRKRSPPAVEAGTRLVVHNDAATPMEFVIGVLKTYFDMSEPRAFHCMMTVHREGSAALGPFSPELATAKVVEITRHARENGVPLEVTVDDNA